MRLFLLIIVIIGNCLKPSESVSKAKEGPFVACEAETACTCENEDGEVNCDNICWTEDEEGEEMYAPLRTPNLIIKKKDFTPEVAYFRNNDISQLIEGQILPGHESTLKELDFSFNRIYALVNSTFKGMNNLRILRLGHNKLKRLKSESFKGGPNWKLHQLYLEYNHLSDLPAAVFDEMPNLEKLVLDGNSKLSLKRKLFSSNLDRLKILSIDDCNISNLDDDLFDDLISLEELSIRNNPFTEVPKALSDIPSLVSLDMSFTDVTELQVNTFSKNKKLKNLILDSLKYLYIVHDCAFCGLDALENVVLSNATELYMIHAGAFGWNHSDMNVAKLTNFNVEFANLTALSPNLFDTSELETAKLGGNQWNCICDMMWILDSDADLDQGSKIPVCSTPETLKGRPLNSLAIQEICPGRLRVSRLILSLFVIVSASMIVILFYYVVTNYRIRNVFYRPDMPHIGYSNLNRAEEEERKKNAMATTQQSPENV
uniref:Leucine-rich repeat-containing protein 70 n=1 Tax=Ascaris suum TaxID=6253 RepID=F1L2C8_ASCSU